MVDQLPEPQAQRTTRLGIHHRLPQLGDGPDDRHLDQWISGTATYPRAWDDHDPISGLGGGSGRATSDPTLTEADLPIQRLAYPQQTPGENDPGVDPKANTNADTPAVAPSNADRASDPHTSHGKSPTDDSPAAHRRDQPCRHCREKQSPATGTDS